MKKLLLFAVVFGGIALTSCSKEKDCKCDTKIDDEVVGTTTTTIEKGDCSDLESSSTTLGITSSVECTQE